MLLPEGWGAQVESAGCPPSGTQNLVNFPCQRSAIPISQTQQFSCSFSLFALKRVSEGFYSMPQDAEVAPERYGNCMRATVKA